MLVYAVGKEVVNGLSGKPDMFYVRFYDGHFCPFYGKTIDQLTTDIELAKRWLDTDAKIYTFKLTPVTE